MIQFFSPISWYFCEVDNNMANLKRPSDRRNQVPVSQWVLQAIIDVSFCKNFEQVALINSLN